MERDEENENNYCSSLSWLFEVFDFTVHPELNANECTIGLVNALVNQSADDF